MQKIQLRRKTINQSYISTEQPKCLKIRVPTSVWSEGSADGESNGCPFGVGGVGVVE